MRCTIFGCFQYAWQGVVYGIKSQRNMRIHIVAAIGACGLGWRLSLSTTEMAVLLLTIGLVVVAELLNTAVEQVVNLTCPHYHPLAKAAKDTAAGAVLAASIIALAVGYYLFVPKLF
jgi:diacylglycerol kinase